MVDKIELLIRTLMDFLSPNSSINKLTNEVYFAILPAKHDRF